MAESFRRSLGGVATSRAAIIMRDRRKDLIDPIQQRFLDAFVCRDRIKDMLGKQLSKRDIAFWRAYVEILMERVPLIDEWNDGTVTWRPRVVRKLLWYSEVPDTTRNRSLAYDWLMRHCVRFL